VNEFFLTENSGSAGTNVAQICNLLYRRFAIGWVPDFSSASERFAACRMQFCDTADYKSALRSRPSQGGVPGFVASVKEFVSFG
jgi:hypothetical protein